MPYLMFILNRMLVMRDCSHFYLMLCMYQTCILAFAFALNCILNMLQVDDDEMKEVARCLDTHFRR
ncbi:hypothetical protein HanXRQr2_Chr14g0639251 [Helianthus annuus]|uniref:Uncharacterized protein n=1 Tax=Helianthus annuus TaxID=4232 RepID=A0A9K3H7A7_HELAN|nr:hypothetical protein HanXRQr2_Chr14g0639251 [Helianthus annuus]KAJ0468181.1 hypothetical protein HanIR_Chr14g0693721 [Helianthus annuus]KAJ0839959.1 hypothetical protein HanPSC8_Chr14g0613051 [Helianthus annuus]